MIRHLLLSLVLIASWAFTLNGQQIIFDQEETTTTGTFQYFGSRLDGTTTENIDNPNPSGINTSSTVIKWVKPEDAQTWAGGFSNPNPLTPVDASEGGTICIQVHMDHIGNVALKLEQSSTGGDDWIFQVPNTKVNEWEELCFDFDSLAIEGTMMPATGHVYNRVVVFTDFGIAGNGTDSTITYLDNITVNQPASDPYTVTNIFDQEETTTTGTFQYFGSRLDGTTAESIPNPNPSGINESSTVIKWVKPEDAQTWAGGFSNPNPLTPVDASNGGKICIQVHMDHIGNVAIKLEQSTTGGDDWVTQVENTKINEWEELCFDFDSSAFEGTMLPATGHIYSRIVIFTDFGTAGNGTDSTIYYLDNITVKTQATDPYLTTNIFDQEDTATTGRFQYFGSRLDGSFTEDIPNPNPSGINESSTVIKWVKPEDAQTWAGGFSNPDPLTPVDATIGGMMCLQVHMDHIGNVALKLEASSTGGENWITQVANTKVNEWEELCFNFDSASIETTMMPATGHIYNRIVVFTDFGIAGNGTDSTIYYLDNFVVKTPTGDNNYDVSFELDMNEFSGAFTQPYVSGNFNNWSGEANPMEDPDGDNIWTATLSIPQGPTEYKFTLDNWTVQEEFNGLEVCTITDPSGEFTNRSLVVNADTEVQSYCWNSCYKCGEGYTVTINVNTALLPSVSEEGIFLAGGEAFGHGDYPMSDDDGDGVWSITFERAPGFASDYTFINGTCLPDWSCKEDISGQACAVPPFNDRRLDSLTADVTINTCFGACTDDGTCPTQSEEYEVTFNVDMNEETVDGGVFLAGGTINNWDPTATEMDDSDGDGVYTVAVMLEAGMHEYKFVNGSTFETLEMGEPCTITDPSGEFTNRLLTLEEGDTTLTAVKFGSCELSTSDRDIYIDETLYEVNPTLVANETILTWNTSELQIESIELVGMDGRIISRQLIQSQSGYLRIDVSTLPAGMYMIIIQSERQIGMQRITRMR